MRRLAMRLSGFAVVVAMTTPALLVTSGGPTVDAAAGAAVTCPAGQPSGAAPGQTSSPTPGRPTTYPLGQCQLLLSMGAIPAGGTVTVTGSGFGPFTRVALSLGSTALGSVNTDGNGSFTAREVIPSSTPPGTYVMTASGGGQTLASQLVVTGNGSGNSGAATPSALAAGTPSGGGSSGTQAGGSSSGGGSTSGASPSHVAAPARANHAQPGSPLAWAGMAVLALLALAVAWFLALRWRRTAAGTRPVD